MAVQIQLRRDTTINWNSVNPMLSHGEVGYDITLNRLKIGDGVNSWTGLTYLFADSSLQFISNTGLEYNSLSAQTIYNTTIDVSLQAPATIGGILAGTTAGDLTGKTLVELFNDLIFPTVQSTYTIPTITITNNTGLTQEVGRIINPTLILSGIKNDSSELTLLNIYRNSVQISTTSSPAITSQTDIDARFGYTDENNPNFKYTLVYTDNYTIPVTITTSPSYTIYNGTGDYNSGLTKKDNKGIYDIRPYAVRSINAPQSSSIGFASNNITISGWYPYFYGNTSSIKTPAEIVSIIQSGAGYTKVIASGGGTLSMSFNAVDQWPWFAVFNTFPTKTKWYETAFNNGNIGGLTDMFSAPTILSIISPDGLWTTTFKIYVTQLASRTIGTCDIKES